jgi:ABC-type transporter Mla subunit MlaD
MTSLLTLVFESGLCILLAATLIYCVVLERRLKAVRQGQEGLNAMIGDLNASLATAGASLRALQTAAGTVGEQLDKKLAGARAAIDELGLVTASAERIAQRMERTVDNRAAMRAPVMQTNAHLPSGSIMGRLDALRTAR